MTRQAQREGSIVIVQRPLNLDFSLPEDLEDFEVLAEPTASMTAERVEMKMAGTAAVDAVEKTTAARSRRSSRDGR